MAVPQVVADALEVVNDCFTNSEDADKAVRFAADNLNSVQAEFGQTKETQSVKRAELRAALDNLIRIVGEAFPVRPMAAKDKK
jgi:hypothetical protein